VQRKKRPNRKKKRIGAERVEEMRTERERKRALMEEKEFRKEFV